MRGLPREEVDDWQDVATGSSLTERGVVRGRRSPDVKGLRARAQGFRTFQVRRAVGVGGPAGGVRYREV